MKKWECYLIFIFFLTIIFIGGKNYIYANNSINSIGAIDADTGRTFESQIRSRTGYYDINTKKVTVNAQAGMKYAVFCYDSNKVYKGWTGWLSSPEYSIKNGTTYIRVVMASTSDKVLIQDDIEYYMSNIFIKSRILPDEWELPVMR